MMAEFITYLPYIFLALGIIITVISLLRYSMVGVMLGLFTAFVGAFYVFNLGRLPAFKYVKLVFDLVIGPFQY